MKKKLVFLLIPAVFAFFIACDSGPGSEPIDESYAPAAPTDCAVSAISDSTVTVSWNDNSDNERGFIVERAEGDGEYTEVDRTGSNGASFTENLPDGTVYRYRVTAYNNFASSAVSNEAVAKRPAQAEEEIVKEDGATLTMGTVAAVTIAPDGISGNGTIVAVEGVKEESVVAEQVPNLSFLSDIRIFSVVDFSQADLILSANAQLTMNYDPAMIAQYNSDLDAQFASLVSAGEYTQAQVDGYKLAAADLDIYYFNTKLGRWVKTRAAHDTESGTLTLKTPYLGIYGIGFNLAEKTGMSIENDEELQKYMKELYNQPDDEAEASAPEGTACVEKRGGRAYSDCTLCPENVDGVTEVAGVPLGCNNCTSVGQYVDQAWNGLFTGSCAKHDCCYNHGRMTYGHKKNDCDRRFWGDMSHRCFKKHGPFVKVNLGLFKIWLPNPFWLVTYPACMISASGMAGVVAVWPSDGHLVPYAEQPCYDFLNRGVDCNIPRLLSIDADSYGCKEGETVPFTSDIYNKDSRPITYAWTATAGAIDDPGAANVTWDSTGVPDNTLVTISCTISDGENSIPSISKKVLVYELEEWIEWGVQTGTSDIEGNMVVVTDDENNIYTIGFTEGSFPDFANIGSRDLLIQKYDSNGTLLWTKQDGTSEADSPWAGGIDSENNTVYTGITHGTFPGVSESIGLNDVFVQKRDASGDVVWSSQTGTDRSDYVYDLCVDTSDNVYIAGNTSGAFAGYTNVGSADGFLQKFDKDGTLLWTVQNGTTLNDYYMSVTADNSGHVYIGGGTNGAFPGFANAGMADVVLHKFTESGELLWTRQIGTSAEDVMKGLIADNFGNVYLLFRTSGSLPGFTNPGGYDIVIQKYSGSGDLLWTQQKTSVHHYDPSDEPYAILLDPQGNILIGGYTTGTFEDDATNFGSADFFIQKYDSFGNYLWTRQSGGSANEIMRGLTFDKDGKIIISGYTYSSYAAAVQGTFDMLTVKLK